MDPILNRNVNYLLAATTISLITASYLAVKKARARKKTSDISQPKRNTGQTRSVREGDEPTRTQAGDRETVEGKTERKGGGERGEEKSPIQQAEGILC